MQSSAHYNTHSDHIPLSYLIKYLISVITGTLDLIVIIIITLVHFIYLLFIRSFPDFVTVFYEGPLSATLGATRAPSPKVGQRRGTAPPHVQVVGPKNVQSVLRHQPSFQSD